MQRIINRIGIENLIEIAAISYLLHFELKGAFSKELKERVEERIEEIRKEEKSENGKD